ncbi:MAG: ABC transporter permease, partial [Gemmatimonadetes bacterium]|nr:ABC transporter permease [Gemmatimonadota bacterium]
RQMLSESSLLAILGTALGVVAAVVLNDVLSELFYTLSAGVGLELELDHRVLALTALAGVGAALVAGGAPALHVVRTPPSSALSARGERPGVGWIRSALVLGQVSVSVVLVVATGLFVRAFVEAARADPGFDADQVASVLIDEPNGLKELIEQLEGVPAIEAVSMADGPPVGLARSPLRVVLPGLDPPPGSDDWVVDARRVGARYLEVLGIPLRSGRDISEADADEGPRVAVVSVSFVDRFWPGETAVGRALVVGGETIRVVGVAEDARYLAQDDDPDPLVYVSLGRDLPVPPVLTLRAPSPEELSAEIRRVVSQWRPGARPVVIQSVRTVLDRSLLPQRLGAALVGGMGLAALLLAVVGLYGLVQYSVTRQTQELAVRLALGGTGRNVLMVVVRKGLGLAVAGVFLGAGVALVVTPALSGFLGSVGPRDPVVYGVVILTFSVAALLASWLPARRASSIEPARVLRGG